MSVIRLPLGIVRIFRIPASSCASIPTGILGHSLDNFVSIHLCFPIFRKFVVYDSNFCFGRDFARSVFFGNLMNFVMLLGACYQNLLRGSFQMARITVGDFAV